MRTATEFITTSRAAQLLATAGEKRSLSAKLAEAYSRDMTDSGWLLTPQGLVIRQFDGTGNQVEERLEDGQHRCRAVQLAARKLGDQRFGVLMTVTYLDESDPDIHGVLDTGRSRSFADLLKMGGTANYSQIAAVTRKVWDYDNGQPVTRIRQPTRRELFSVLHGSEADDLAAAARYSHSWNGTAIMSPAAAGFTRFLLTRRVVARKRRSGGADVYEPSQEDTTADAAEFLRQMATGASLEEDSPVFQFRRWRLEGAGQYSPAGWRGSKSANTMQAHIVQTWNAWRAGAQVRRFLPMRKLSNDTFPKPV